MNYVNGVYRSVVLGVLVLIGAGTLLGQYRAGVQGAVTDPQGAVVPEATVTLTSQETNRKLETRTNSGGVYTFNALSPGRYSLSVTKDGFKTQVLDVLVNAEQMQAYNVELQVGSASETVSVSDVAPTINTETGTISGTVSSQQIQSLPSFGRDPYQLLQLAPGVFGDNAHTNSGGSQDVPGSAGPGGSSATSSIFQTENQVQINANGTRNISNSFQIDGIEVNSLAWGGAAVITPHEESVKEVQVQANPYSAENGRNSGAQVMVVSKNGTNDWHGSAFFKMDRPGLNAYQRWNGPENPVQRVNNRFNQFGGSVGGPVLKNKLFFFFSYETLRNRSVENTDNWYETPQFLSTVPAANPNSIAAKIAGYKGEGVSFNAITPRSCAEAGMPDPATCQVITSNGQYMGLDVGSPLKGLPLGVQDPGWKSNGQFGTGGGLPTATTAICARRHTLVGQALITAPTT